MKLYSYYQSSSAWRVRIALHYKQIPFEYAAVNLAAGDQFSADVRALSPMSKVPVLDLGARVLTESMAILEYLEETHPIPPLLPRDPYLRARARMLAQIVVSGIQPFQNLETRNRVKELGADPKAWSALWIGDGLAALERAVGETAGAFSVGESPSFADVCLVPQLATARRFRVELAAMPTLLRIEAACATLPAFVAAHADKQPDAPVLG